MFLRLKVLLNCQPSNCRAVGGLWMLLGKIKCAAKALACVSACNCFNFTKRWHFRPLFLSIYCRSCRTFRLIANVLRVGDVALCCACRKVILLIRCYKQYFSNLEGNKFLSEYHLFDCLSSRLNIDYPRSLVESV